MERRASTRVKCRFDCTIVDGSREVEGTVLDLSEGGLAIRCQEQLDQGQTVWIRIKASGKTVALQAMIWHCRRMRARGASAAISWQLGLMVTNAPDDYFALLPKEEAPAAEATGPPSSPAIEPEQARPAPTPMPEPDPVVEEEAVQTAPTPMPPPDPVPEEAYSVEVDVDGTDGLTTYHVRVKQRAAPRTRVLSLMAESQEQARSAAATDLSDEWEIIEVSEA